MDRKIALKWARALESGEYGQTTGALREGNKFCCLGVLCNLHAQAHPEIAKDETDPEKYMGKEGELPEQVMHWAGMRSDNGKIGDGVRLKVRDKKSHSQDEMTEYIRDLIDLNDHYEFDFPKIAKVIREHSDKL